MATKQRSPRKGTIRKFPGEGTRERKLKHPRGLFHRNNGDFALCDSGNYRVLVLDCELNCKSVIQFNSFDNQFCPIDVVVFNNGHFYITDCNNYNVVICTEKCKIIKVLQFTYQGKHICPDTICLSMGDIYITDWDEGCVHCIDGKSKKLIRSCKLGGVGDLYSICVNTNGHIMVSDYNQHCIHILDKDLNKLTTQTHQLLKKPRGLCLDQFDNLYVCEGRWGDEGRLLHFTSQGEFVSQIADSEVYDPDSIVVTDDIIAWTERRGHCVKILYR